MSRPQRVDRAALLTGGRSRVPSTGNPLLAAGPEPVSAAALAMGLPIPREAASYSPVLLESERRDLAACELAVDHLRAAFWAAGKALQVIRDGRLYRETHGTFEAYAAERWDMSRAQAYRLIEAWPVAERLGMSPIGDMLTESHVRALLPVARRHGPDVAAEMYRVAAGTDGLRVTAALLSDASRALLEGSEPLAADQAAEAVRAFLADRNGGADTEPAGDADRNAAAELAAEVRRIEAVLRRMERRGLASIADTGAVRRLLASLQPPVPISDVLTGPAVPLPDAGKRYRLQLGCGDTIDRDYPPLDPTTTCPQHGRQDVLGYEDTGLTA